MFESAEGSNPMTRRPKCGWIAAAILTLLASTGQDGAQAAVVSGMAPPSPHSSAAQAMFRLPGGAIGRMPRGRLPGIGKRPGPVSKGILNAVPKTPKGTGRTNATGGPPKPSTTNPATPRSTNLDRSLMAGPRTWLLSPVQSRRPRHSRSWERAARHGLQLPCATPALQDRTQHRSPQRFSIASATGRVNSWSR